MEDNSEELYRRLKYDPARLLQAEATVPMKCYLDVLNTLTAVKDENARLREELAAMQHKTEPLQEDMRALITEELARAKEEIIRAMRHEFWQDAVLNRKVWQGVPPK